MAGAATLKRAVEIRAELLSLIEPEAIVITDRGDKLLFPERRVRVPLRDETTMRLLPTYVEHGPVYYYGITLPPQDFEFLDHQVLAPQGLMVHFVKTFDAESLYLIHVDEEMPEREHQHTQ